MRRALRICAYKFLREECPQYFVHNSKIKNPFSYIKYRHIITRGVKFPEQFVQIKA